MSSLRITILFEDGLDLNLDTHRKPCYTVDMKTTNHLNRLDPGSVILVNNKAWMQTDVGYWYNSATKPGLGQALTTVIGDSDYKILHAVWRKPEQGDIVELKSCDDFPIGTYVQWTENNKEYVVVGSSNRIKSASTGNDYLTRSGEEYRILFLPSQLHDEDGL